jgi:outer membrane protein insertion porin family
VQDSSNRPDGRIVVFHLKERPVIRAIMYEGIRSASASEIRTRFLQKGVGLDVETPLNMNRLKDVEKTLRELLAERGHPHAIVRPTLQMIPGTNTARLVITVQEEPSGPTP